MHCRYIDLHIIDVLCVIIVVYNVGLYYVCSGDTVVYEVVLKSCQEA